MPRRCNHQWYGARSRSLCTLAGLTSGYGLSASGESVDEQIPEALSVAFVAHDRGEFQVRAMFDDIFIVAVSR